MLIMHYVHNVSKYRTFYLTKLRFLHNIYPTVLGIETSCDDTGCAVVNMESKILGEALHSQNSVHVRFGGINPTVAHDLHRDHIELAVSEALDRSKLGVNEIDAIAVTVKPGLKQSLYVGVQYAKYLAHKHHKKLIPIHHMEAHALVARMYHDLPFPFLVLLISGGHCLLALARGVDDFLLLGESLDNAPGEVMDKVARRMKLRNIFEYSKMAGGQAIEMAAKKAKNPDIFEFPIPLIRNKDCNFSFSGLKDSVERKLFKKEKQHIILGSNLIPEIYDLCAAFQIALTEHIIHRVERAIIYTEKNNLIPKENRKLIVSGGVACNNFIFESIKLIGDKRGFKVYRPPSKLCTDNGVMIAWNGIEKLRDGSYKETETNSIEVEPIAPLGINAISEVTNSNIPVKVTRLKKIKFHS